MSQFMSAIESQLMNFKAFRPFFTPGRVLRDAVTFPKDYYLGDGKTTRFPSIINLNITTVCNLKCPFCFNMDILGKRTELSTEQMEDIVDQVAANRGGLFLSGGEPFARKDIFEIIEHAKSKGVPVGVVTNATLFTREKVQRLYDIGLDVVVISFHGTEEAHDKAVLMKGAYKKTLQALKWFAEIFPSPGPMINYVLTEHSIPHMSDFFKEIGDIPNVAKRLSHLNFVTPDEAKANETYWMEKFGEAPQLLQYEYHPSDRMYEPIIQQLERNPEIFTKPVINREEMKTWYSDRFDLKRRCVFIWKSTFINSDGDMYPCQFLMMKMGNIKEHSIEELWNGEKYRRFRALLREGLTPGCARCCKL